MAYNPAEFVLEGLHIFKLEHIKAPKVNLGKYNQVEGSFFVKKLCFGIWSKVVTLYILSHY